MSIKVYIKLTLIVLFLAGVVGSGYYVLFLTQLNSNKKTTTLADSQFGWKFPIAKFPSTGSEGNLAYSSIRDPGGEPRGLPVRLKIPTINVDTAIEDARITADGRMDVPAGSVNVAWFALGPHPGDVGSAVIGGHFGIENNVPKVFYNLNKLKAGDKVYIVDDRGETLAFIVRRTQSFDRNGDSTTVFTSSDGLAHLNLITCEGIWNQVNDTYPQRLVVFTDAIPSEGAVFVKKTAIPTKAKTPTVTPTPTKSPTINLPEAGHDAEPTLSIELTESPNTNAKSPVSPEVLIASAKSLYATPVDAAVTSFFVVSIIFVAIKILRR